MADTTQTASYTLEVVSQHGAHTQQLGAQLGALLQGGELILLAGHLGAGKTTFTQGLAQGLHVTQAVSSPTFTLLKEYPVPEHSTPALRPSALYHFDLYRLDDADEMFELGFEEYFSGSGVCVVEWAEKAAAFWPAEHLTLALHMLDQDRRRLLFVATGSHYCELLRQWQQQYGY
jgi:tRNA threonylcarbamoyladenosine biosynthesis protein TsaE